MNVRYRVELSQTADMGGCADHGVELRPIGVKVFAERLTSAPNSRRF